MVEPAEGDARWHPTSAGRFRKPSRGREDERALARLVDREVLKLMRLIRLNLALCCAAAMPLMAGFILLVVAVIIAAITGISHGSIGFRVSRR